MTSFLYLIVAGIFLGAAWQIQKRHREQVRHRRGAIWQGCLHLFDSPSVQQDSIDFPVLQGKYRGYDVKLEPITDDIGYRKLPQLWLRVTVFSALPFAGSLDYLARPENIEFYSSFWTLPEQLSLPDDWPQQSALRTDDHRQMPPLEILTPHMGMFEDGRAKELVVSPRGVRLVYQLDQGVRAYYAVFRSLRFANLPVEPQLVAGLLDYILALMVDLEKAGKRMAQTASCAEKEGGL